MSSSSYLDAHVVEEAHCVHVAGGQVGAVVLHRVRRVEIDRSVDHDLRRKATADRGCRGRRIACVGEKRWLLLLLLLWHHLAHFAAATTYVAQIYRMTKRLND